LSFNSAASHAIIVLFLTCIPTIVSARIDKPGLIQQAGTDKAGQIGASRDRFMIGRS